MIRAKVLLAWMGLVLVGVAQAEQDRPNILWITCEDISPYLGSYGCKEAQTPHLDRLAEGGVRYTHAYANAPVCAVARSTLLAGMYASTIGTHQMRCNVQLPETIPIYSKLLREAGYYCTNNHKKDYNSPLNGDRSLWDEDNKQAHWRNRKDGQPFFAIFNIITTHESQLSLGRINKYVKDKQIPETPRVDPATITLPPYHPDTPAVRADWARLHDLITYMDTQAGQLIKELEAEGVADNTIIFFYSDHGGMLSRSKRFIYNVGTQVPFIVHFPKRWQHLAPGKPGTACDRLVSFVDFPKTVLSLANANVPDRMQGRIFLGEQAEPAPETVHFYRDRMAERFDFCRAVTDGRYYLIHNFMPHRPRGRSARYGYTVQANWRAWEEAFEAGKCDPVQSQFYQPKPAVQFFDTQTDPWQVKNLAGDPDQQARLKKLEDDLDAWMIRTRDLGLVPEAMFNELIGPDKPHKTHYEFGCSDAYPVANLLEIAKTASLGQKRLLPDYLKFARDENPIARYYGAYALFLARSHSAEVQQVLKTMIGDDAMSANRVMAAQALARCGDPDTAFQALKDEAAKTQYGYTFLMALNAFQYGHIDDRLTLEDWNTFEKRTFSKTFNPDVNGSGYANRIIDDAIKLWPERRVVD